MTARAVAPVIPLPVLASAGQAWHGPSDAAGQPADRPDVAYGFGRIDARGLGRVRTRRRCGSRIALLTGAVRAVTVVLGFPVGCNPCAATGMTRLKVLSRSASAAI